MIENHPNCYELKSLLWTLNICFIYLICPNWNDLTSQPPFYVDARRRYRPINTAHSHCEINAQWLAKEDQILRAMYQPQTHLSWRRVHMWHCAFFHCGVRLSFYPFRLLFSAVILDADIDTDTNADSETVIALIFTRAARGNG